MEDMKLLYISILQSLLSVVSITLHSIAITLLRRPNTFPANQNTYLIQTSSIEIIFLLLQNVAIYVNFFPWCRRWNEYVRLLLVCGAALPWIYMMTCMTIDRFLQVFFY